MADIELTNFKENDIEKYGSHLKPTKTSLARSIYIILAETTVSLAIYYKYLTLNDYHFLLAPLLLGSSTAALAQSLNQLYKKTFSLNKIMKFMVWGGINGIFSSLWIDFLVARFDTLVTRILVDQMLGSPLFQMTFVILSCIWDNSDISLALKSTYLRSLKVSYAFWPFFSILSFSMIPEHLIFPSNCLANLVWNLILSLLS